MRRIPSFDPGNTALYPFGTGTIDVGAVNDGAQVLLYNESPFNLDISFLNGNQSILHAWEARWWRLDGETRQLEWTIDTALNVTGPPISLVMGEVYDTTEKIEGAYPMALIRQASVGNPNAVGGTAQQLTNTGNVAGSNIISSTPAGGNLDVSLNNDGTGYIGVTIAGVLIKLIQFSLAEPLVLLGAANHIVENPGNEKIDGTFTVVGATTLGDSVSRPGATVNGTLTAVNALNVNGTTNGITNLGPLITGAVGKLLHDLGDLTIDGTSTFTGDAFFSNKKMSLVTSGDGIDLSASGLFAKGNPTNAGAFHYQSVNGTTDWQLSAIGPAVTGSASATVNHLVKVGAVSTAPNQFLMNPSTGGGSQTFGFNAITSTQVAVALGATNAYAFKGVV